MTRIKVRGTQSIRRATLIMKAIATHNHEGIRLTDLSQNLPIDRTTIYRIVKSLVEEQFITQDPGTKRLYLGQTLFELGIAAAPRFNLRDLFQPILARIAEKTGDAVLLNIRSGNEYVCIERKQGAYPVRVYTLNVGERRPLGNSASGIAILSALSDEEVRRVMSENEAELVKYKNRPLRAKKLIEAIRQTREKGYAVYYSDLADIRAVAIAVNGRKGMPFAAISVTAISSRMTDSRQREIAKLLKLGAGELEKLLSEQDMSASLP